MKDINFTELHTNLNRFRLSYKFALEEMHTKINILREEFHVIHEYNPIEHISTRLKSPESILKKVSKKGIKLSLDEMRENIRDIAGLRITCSFIEDIYKVSDLIQSQDDITVVEVKDYITNPKPNGYQSLHLVVKVPIFLSDGVESVYVEIQIRTIAMDFWASLEHKIYYKYNKNIPAHIQDGLKEAATQAAMLDRKMEQINHEVNILKQQDEKPKDFMTPEDVYQFLKKLSQTEGKVTE
ncbi:GTP pyrophosphokinase family protein [Bacillus sp. CGMCC 1.16541]|uniref:GTP pyrophosphokinase n=1 Tax=Bacillus sp. CGMCC 1.16541 TaxID=2185143 RepID=UPI001EF584BD|nr:GTP pyrophosphokinase family protein [Bacillus sp. CGMCC 1.16541]